MSFWKSNTWKYTKYFLLLIAVITSWVFLYRCFMWKVENAVTKQEEIESYCLGHEKFWLDICKEMEYAKQKQGDSLNDVITRSYRKDFRQKVLAEPGMKRCLKRFKVSCGIYDEKGNAIMVFERKTGFFIRILLDFPPGFGDRWHVWFIVDENSPLAEKLHRWLKENPKPNTVKMSDFYCWEFGNKWMATKGDP